MATMQELVQDVLDELRFASGQGVQIHLETGISKNISRIYRALMLKYKWRDYTYSTAFVTAANGEPTTDLSTVLDKFSNIIAIFPEKESTAIPFAGTRSNPSINRRPVIVNRPAPKLFAVWPGLADRSLVLLSRKFQETDFDMSDEVPFYRDLLVLAAAHMLAMKSDINSPLTKSLEQQFNQLLQTYRNNEMSDAYPVNPYSGTYPTEWFVDE